jgi:hypothetical protein
MLLLKLDDSHDLERKIEEMNDSETERSGDGEGGEHTLLSNIHEDKLQQIEFHY